MRPTPQHPHRRIPASSQSTKDNQPNRSAYRETKFVHTDDRAHCPDARTTMRQPPYAGTHHGNRATGCPTSAPATHRAHHDHRPSNTSPNSAITRPSLRESQHYHYTHALSSPEDPNASKLTPRGQAARLHSMRPSYSFAPGGSRSNRGWPGHWHPKTATPQTVPKDTEAKKAPVSCLTHRP